MSTPTTHPSPARPASGRLRAPALVVGVLGLALAGCSSGETVQLTATGGDAAASCIVFDVGTLAGMSPAFAGTVVEVDGSVATLEVDRWYAGGDADRVAITSTAGMEALLGTPTLEVDRRYLITAAGGEVNGCGYSGPATPELESAFEEAFAG
ncbi:hypothetical protein [Ornithinimicrobium cerasi]|uniref:Uncharacterized protein n=1 Tax=Ornithinimicrobium cerasi TaxID=2248773 RepID=A0A285VLZ4_9MICO|nr:hypothetical protein [Ornithinimicrobium cerasi]SOC54236.1 hypothetical protein SAMN05421879_10323 [Ornithinimicrobium cerasi]